jgi:transaldolase
MDFWTGAGQDGSPKSGVAMKFFVDTAEVSEIKALIPTGLVDGVTTNPSLVAKSGRDFREMIAEVCALVPGPVSAEVTALETEQMVVEGKSLAKIAKNVVVKLPLTLKGIAACKTLTGEGIKTNVTLCFSVNQALIAAKAGATFISPFIGRLDDIGQDGMELIREIRTVYDNYGFRTEILAASIRSPQHMRESALAGADVATAPPSVIKALANHPLTDKGLEAFLADWAKTGQKII